MFTARKLTRQRKPGYTHISFNHDTFFLLDGKHSSLDCNACHKDQVFGGIPKECSACHAEPEIHASFFGLQCQDCHSTSAWSPAPLKIHAFPIDHGGKGKLECQSCHPANYVTYTCYSCHDHQPNAIAASHARLRIDSSQLANCFQCHKTGLKGDAKQ